MLNQSYITLPERDQKLSGEFISGYIEGEGCFSLAITKKKGYLLGVQIYPSFNLQVHVIDKPLLEKIKKVMNCGRIYTNSKRKLVNFKVYRYDDLVNKVIPFFDKYQFHGNKKRSFEIFKEIMSILDKPGRISEEDLSQVASLKVSMNHRGDEV
jgi:hypothetical protein